MCEQPELFELFVSWTIALVPGPAFFNIQQFIALHVCMYVCMYESGRYNRQIFVQNNKYK